MHSHTPMHAHAHTQTCTNTHRNAQITGATTLLDVVMGRSVQGNFLPNKERKGHVRRIDGDTMMHMIVD